MGSPLNSKMQLIGLHGKKQVGKDTIAEYLVDQYFYERIAFADVLKEAVANLFNISREMVDELKLEDSIGCKGHVVLQIDGFIEYDYSWREFLQRFGTEMGRNTFGQHFWLDAWHDRYEAARQRKQNVVVTDVRFENEARRILSEGGYVIEVTRPTSTNEDEHASEQRISEELIDGWIDNNGTIEQLYADVDQLMEDIENGKIVHLGVSSGN